MMCSHLGVHVYHTYVNRAGFGFCVNRIQSSKVKELRFTVSGYVAERMHSGRDVSIEDFLTSPEMQDDARDALKLLEDRRLKGNVALQKALEYNMEYFLANWRRLMVGAERLNRMRVVPGRYYNGRFP
jgi:hypothetical protein